jgi:hypothetical protein
MKNLDPAKEVIHVPAKVRKAGEYDCVVLDLTGRQHDTRDIVKAVQTTSVSGIFTAAAAPGTFACVMMAEGKGVRKAYDAMDAVCTKGYQVSNIMTLLS